MGEGGGGEEQEGEREKRETVGKRAGGGGNRQQQQQRRGAGPALVRWSARCVALPLGCVRCVRASVSAVRCCCGGRWAHGAETGPGSGSSLGVARASRRRASTGRRRQLRRAPRGFSIYMIHSFTAARSQAGPAPARICNMQQRRGKRRRRCGKRGGLPFVDPAARCWRLHRRQQAGTGTASSASQLARPNSPPGARRPAAAVKAMAGCGT
ncbi:hypothetical protein DFH27DRAFT_612210 [Peziza echinospora]|nr:hypothetical protein DFH27DRAFT_612210 [Peziza echinospora]